jgi:hypothetical protein
MTLGQKQRKFTQMLGLLINFAYVRGYELTLSRGYVSEAANEADGGHPRSLHLQRLAIDLNLFKDGVYLTETEDHRELGEFWESIGGTWGGRFNDGNHYSLAHGGMK